MLESLDQSNIKRMSVEKPEGKTQALFDAERDISPQDWQEVMNDLVSLHARDKFVQMIELAWSIRQVDPEAVFENISISDEVDKRLLQFPVELQLINVWAKMKDLCPNLEIPSLIQTEFSEDIKNQMVNGSLDKFSIFVYAEKLVALKQFPEFGLDQFAVGEELRKSMLDNLQFEREKRRFLGDVLNLAANIRRLFPDKVVTLTAEEAEKAIPVSETIKTWPVSQGRWPRFMRLAADLKVLSDQKPVQFESAATPMPEQRNF